MLRTVYRRTVSTPSVGRQHSYVRRVTLSSEWTRVSLIPSKRRKLLLATTTALILAGTVGCTSTDTASPDSESDVPKPTVTITSTPENVVLGGFPTDAEPVATVKPGEVVQIDTLTSAGLTDPTMSPTEYFAQFGVEEDEILPDMTAFWENLDSYTNYGPHIVTGPINVEGAEPGDTLMVEILDVKTRTGYGVSYTGSDSGVFSATYPGNREGDAPLDIAVTSDESFAHATPGVGQHLLRTGVAESGVNKGEDVTFFNDGTEVPLQEFFGVMAVKPVEGEHVGFYPGAPAFETGVQNSVPPGTYGGNLDTRDYTSGATLYLPVNQSGAGFFVGDGHSVQGDGEVAGTANEQSLTGTFRFTVLKGQTSAGPSGEDANNFLIHGIDYDLQRALKLATGETVAFLERTKGLTTAEAYSLTSISVNFTISEAVDATQIVTAHIPKSLWADTGKVEQTDLAKQALTPASTLTVPDKA